jgi:hypothetical protein
MTPRIFTLPRTVRGPAVVVGQIRQWSDATGYALRRSRRIAATWRAEKNACKLLEPLQVDLAASVQTMKATKPYSLCRDHVTRAHQ